MARENEERRTQNGTNAEWPMAPGLHLMDCMEAMKQFPDGYFDLAVVDPPYGDGGQDSSQFRNVERAGHGGTGSADCSTDTKRWNRFGQRFDRYKHLEPICGRDDLRPIYAGGGYCIPNRGNLGR